MHVCMQETCANLDNTELVGLDRGGGVLRGSWLYGVSVCGGGGVVVVVVVVVVVCVWPVCGCACVRVCV